MLRAMPAALRPRVVLVTLLLLGLAAANACMGPAEKAPTDRAGPSDVPVAPSVVAAAATPDAAAAGDPHEASCPHGAGAEGCAHAEVPAAGSSGHFGAPFALASAVPLSGAAVGPGPVQVRGTVSSVCQKKGCWLVLEEGGRSARVLMKDHAFAVPMDCRGKSALVEGVLEERVFTAAQAKHLEEDGGGDPAKVAGERKEYVLSATAVRLES
jgi:hypothetical protein